MGETEIRSGLDCSGAYEKDLRGNTDDKFQTKGRLL